MALTHITPNEAKELMNQGAILIDIREYDEYKREHIAAAKHAQISSLNLDHIKNEKISRVIFHCRLGNRTQIHAMKLRESESCLK